MSAAPPHWDWRGHTLLATSAQSFLGRVRWVVSHRDEVRELAAKARDYALSRSIDREIDAWRAVMREADT